MKIIYRTLIPMLVVFCLLSCVNTNSFSPSEKILYTSVNTLQVAKQFRKIGLESAKIIWDQGLMDVETKDKIVKIADDLQLAINDCADTLRLYYNSNGAVGVEMVNAKLLLYHKLYGQFTDLVMPFVIKKMEKQNG